LRERRAELDAFGVQVFAVTFESTKRVRQFRERETLHVPILRDPSRAAYRAYGIERKPVQSLGSRVTGWYYLRQALRFRLPRVVPSDFFQLGGDVLISASGDICWVYASREPADRPSIDRILREARGCGRD
jgi:hypothetical protein